MTAYAHSLAAAAECQRHAQPAEQRYRGARQEHPVIVVVVGDIDERRQEHGTAKRTDDHAHEKQDSRQVDRRNLGYFSGIDESHAIPDERRSLCNRSRANDRRRQRAYG
jgi:hypothetical protein